MMAPESREEAVLAAIEQRRRRPRRRISDERVTLAHGAGGKATRDLVEALFLPAFDNPLLQPLGDAAVLDAGPDMRLAVTTDAYVVHPRRFPGGDIGELAINGTINDLAMAGAQPLCLTAALVVEEGLPVEELSAIAASMGGAASGAGVPLAAGDTKVVERGKADGLFIATAGIGLVDAALDLGPPAIRPGDRVIVSGPLGDHGMAILLARGDIELEAELESDTAPLHRLVAALLEATPDMRCMRDPTRGGVATALNELALAAELSIVLDETALPVRPAVAGACEILGIDPLYVACEGRLVALVGPDGVEAAMAVLGVDPLGAGAAVVGRVEAEPEGLVLLETALGGSRVVDVLVGDPLPRIC